MQLEEVKGADLDLLAQQVGVGRVRVPNVLRVVEVRGAQVRRGGG